MGVWGVEYMILGPLEVRRDGRAIPVSAPMQRALLAALLMRANQVAALDWLIDQLWGADPPASARVTVQNYVRRLRVLLGEGAEAQPLLTRSPGYLLRVEPGQLDLHRFQELVERAQADLCAGEAEPAASLFREALRLWRGEPLADVPAVDLKRLEVPRLQEYHLHALHGRVEADLALGRHAELVAELPALVEEHPLREPLAAQLMLALYRSGRQAEALEVYHRTRRRLAAELGVQPGPELHRRYREILSADPALDLRPPSTDKPPGGLVPAQLPADVAGFTGRIAALKELDELLSTSDSAVAVITGTAGVGKTALAVHWAHRGAERFPDGQLYVDLRGFDPILPPQHPDVVLRLFLAAFGVPGDRMPSTLDDLVSRYRGLLANRRVLVLLDNARDAEQVRPLLPAAPGCLALVTSRNQLPELLAAGARPVTLDLMTAPEAQDLLAARLGLDRMAAEPAAVDDIVSRCARLPLALAVVAARAATHPDFPLARLATELAGGGAGLDAFAAGDDVATDARAVFSWSYCALSEPAARLFRLLGLHPGPDLSVAAAASLAGVPVTDVRPVLAELDQAHLVAEHAPGRFTLHDLLRAYARELVCTVDSEADRRAATHRVLDHYAHTAYAANRLLYLERDPVTVDPPVPGCTVEPIRDRGPALAWLTTEHRVLLALIKQDGTGFDAHTWLLAWALGPALDYGGHWHELLETQQAALAAAERLGDLRWQAIAWRSMASTALALGRESEAETQLRNALDLAERLGDPVTLASVHHKLSYVLERRRRHRGALAHIERALELFRAAGHRSGEATTLNAVGWQHTLLGNHELALECCRQALALSRELGDQASESATLDSMGHAHRHLGQHREAEDCYQRAIAIRREMGDRRGEAATLVHLGDARQVAGDRTAAREAWGRALSILEDVGSPDADRVRVKLAGN